MKKVENKKTIYYKTYTDDVVESKNQNYKIKDNYKWIHKNIFYRMCSFVVWKVVPLAFILYYKLILHVKIENQKVLIKYFNKGYFMYGNHTQTVRRCFYAYYGFG